MQELLLLGTSLCILQPAQNCWRPSLDDVDRISYGKPAKKKGTGSRGVPHRLNADERKLYDFARAKGFVDVAGTGWRKQRADAPLVNTYRSWCDARAVPAIFLHKGNQGIDEVIVDLSPLRNPSTFADTASFCFQEAADGTHEALNWIIEPSHQVDRKVGLQVGDLVEAYANDPIYRIPMYVVSWERPRNEAKALAKVLAIRLKTLEVRKGRRKERGAPNVAPGKSRRSGGYGIG